MARADLLLSLVRAGCRGDYALFRKTVEAIIAEERAKQHHVVAEQLEEVLRKNIQSTSARVGLLSDEAGELFYERSPVWSIQDLILRSTVSSAVQELVEEHHRSDLLRSFGLEPRHRVLLIGPPGNGKTTLAEAFAAALLVPFITIRYENVIGSYLGETALKLKRVLDYARNRHCVLFLDEFDTLGKERGDSNETGEIKRVVSSLLLQIDNLPSYVVIIAATNHAELLDRAVWRRFQLRISLPAPDISQIELQIERFAARLDTRLGYSPTRLARELSGASFAEVEEFCSDIQRRYVLSDLNVPLKEIVGRTLKLWKERATIALSQQE